MTQAASIGIFDSGFGGLTVMHAIRQALPHENIIYFGDTARLPYGNKSAETILRYVVECSNFLLSKEIKLLVIACHTACSFALEQLSPTFPIPLVGVIPPAVEELGLLPRCEKIVILGTRSTIASGVYQDKVKKHLPFSLVTAIPCPLFVPLVEEGYTHHPLTDMAVQEYLRPLRDQKIDAALLGCTHYPLLLSTIRKELGDDVSLIDPALACAQKVLHLLRAENLLNPQTSRPHYQFYVSDDPSKFRLLGQNFLNYPIEDVRIV